MSLVGCFLIFDISHTCYFFIYLITFCIPETNITNNELEIMWLEVVVA